MTKALAKEVGPSNIRVNAIAPGAIDTDMNKDLTKKEIEELEEEIPLGRMGKPEDIANCVKWLTENEYITGQIITIDRWMDKLKKEHFENALFLLLICYFSFIISRNKFW